MINKISSIIILCFLNFILIHCQITGEYDQIISNELDYINVKYIPSILHNDNVYLTIVYKCSSELPRRISLSIYIERTLYRTNLSVFRRHWFCQKSSQIKIRYIRVQLRRSLAYASDIQLPIEQGQLKLIMYKNKQENENEILKQNLYNVRFLRVDKRPNDRSYRWQPLMNKTTENICLKEPGNDISFQ